MGVENSSDNISVNTIPSNKFLIILPIESKLSLSFKQLYIEWIPMVKFITITEDHAGQRIDNFLVTALKGVPKSRIYRGLRKGEFRVNSGRVSADYRLAVADRLRIPPLRTSSPAETSAPPSRLLAMLESRILYEDDHLLAINKPSGIPVHGGSKISWGLIELLRQLRPKAKALELIHRIDKDTSGCLLIAKKRSCLLEWHRLLANRQVKKRYLVLVKGRWDPAKKVVKLPLKKNTLQSGERVVRVDQDGKPAETRFMIEKQFKDATLLSAEIVTGRTHQIRVHTAASGHPIAGDEKYGSKTFNRMMREKGLSRLFLHSSSMKQKHLPADGFQGAVSPLDPELEAVLERID